MRRRRFSHTKKIHLHTKRFVAAKCRRDMLLQFRLRKVSHFPRESETRALENHPTRERQDAAGREDCRPPRLTRRVSPFFRGVIFTGARVSPALLSLRENGRLLVVYCNLSPSLYTRLEFGAAQLRAVTEIAPKSAFLCVNRCPLRYGFRAGAKAIRYSENTALVYRLFTVRAPFLNFSDLILRQTLKVSTRSLVVNFICIQNYTYFINSS